MKKGAMNSNLGGMHGFFGWHIGQVVLLACILILPGCAGFKVKYKQNQAFAEHVANAKEMEQQDKLADALDQWRIAAAINAESTEAIQRAQALEEEIVARVSDFIAQADDAASKGNVRASEQLLLSALSLQPDNRSLFQRVAKEKRRVAQARIPARPSQEDDGRHEESESLEGPTLVNLSAESKFQAGVELIGTDRARSEQLFLDALELDSTHLGAKAYLQILSEEK